MRPLFRQGSNIFIFRIFLFEGRWREILKYKNFSFYFLHVKSGEESVIVCGFSLSKWFNNWRTNDFYMKQQVGMYYSQFLRVILIFWNLEALNRRVQLEIF